MDLFEVVSRFIPLSFSFSPALDPKYSYIIYYHTLREAVCASPRGVHVWGARRGQLAFFSFLFFLSIRRGPDSVVSCSRKQFDSLVFSLQWTTARVQRGQFLFSIFWPTPSLPPPRTRLFSRCDAPAPPRCPVTPLSGCAEIIPPGICLISLRTCR